MIKNKNPAIFMGKKEQLGQSEAMWLGQEGKAKRYFCNFEERKFTSKQMAFLINDKRQRIIRNRENHKESQKS